MSLRDNWKDIIDGESEIIGENINNIAHAVIKIEEKGVSGTITVDDMMSDTSENPIQNKVVKSYVDGLVGDIDLVLDELHNYAQSIVNGGAE